MLLFFAFDCHWVHSLVARHPERSYAAKEFFHVFLKIHWRRDILFMHWHHFTVKIWGICRHLQAGCPSKGWMQYWLQCSAVIYVGALRSYECQWGTACCVETVSLLIFVRQAHGTANVIASRLNVLQCKQTLSIKSEAFFWTGALDWEGRYSTKEHSFQALVQKVESTNCCF